MFRIVICDDSVIDLQKLRAATEQWIQANIGISASIDIFRKPEELQTVLEKDKKRFDLYFLDVMMENMNGIQLGRLIRENDADASVIYVTSFKEYALDAYNIHALRYLTKPIDYDELYSALELAYALFSMRPRHTLLINGADSVTSIIMEEIMYVENNLRNMIYNMANGKKVFGVRRSGTFEEAVGPIAADAGFIQPHKSYFVNIKYIRSMQVDTIVMDDGKNIPIARRRLAEIQNKYICYISEGVKK